MKRYYFLLGGKDLEMLEIKNILNKKNIEFDNHDLTWANASWKNYKEVAEKKINEGYTVVGVELMDKTYMPERDTIDIDHHNYDRCKSASIEQVAKLLDVRLSDWQNMVALNDKAYIPGLFKSGLQLAEIKKIRRKDREAQDLKETKFVEAQAMIKKKVEYDENNKLYSIIAENNDDSFTPLVDAFFFSKIKEGKNSIDNIKLIVYNDNNFIFSGYILSKVIEKYKKVIESGKAFFGGLEPTGYFGFTSEYVQEKGVLNIVDEWKELYKNTSTIIRKKERMHSYHMFLFPFRWKNLNEEDTLANKFDLAKFENALLSSQEKEGWERSKYSLSDGAAYNEYNYFFDFVREILYDLDEELITSSNKHNHKLIRHYNYKPSDISKGKTMYYNIKLKDGVDYSLELDSILLNMYNTGVGVLSFHMRNFEYCTEKEILEINKFGRRVYLPFLSLLNDGIKRGKEETLPGDWLQGVKNIELPEAIWLGDENGKKQNSLEDFSTYYCAENFKHGPFLLPKFITALFPKNFFLTHEKLATEQHKIYLRPALDDRMYTISWFGNRYVNELTRIDYSKNPYKYNYQSDDFWHNYTFIDTERMFQNQLELPKCVNKHTYSRWVDYGTLYGFSRYSMVMLTSPLLDLEHFNAAFLVRHLQTMYYKLAELSLVQRASIISFSDEITHVSDLVHNDTEKAVSKIEELYKHYILFVNKIYFREVTSQEQGIEMYDMMQRIMRIPEQVKDLDNEIAELNSFAGMIAGKNEHEEMKKHTLLATVFLPFMFISGFLGMDYFKNNDVSWNSIFAYLWFWGLSILLLSVTLFAVKYKYLKKRNLHIPLLISIFWLGLLTVIGWIYK